MTEQQMPERIWVRVCGGGVSMPSGRVYTAVAGQDVNQERHAPFIRADIAERMAEALEEVKAKYDFDDRLPDDHPIKKVRSALSVFKGASHV